MHQHTLTTLRYLVNHRCIGGKHMRYDLLRKRWKNAPRQEQRIVEEELRLSPWIIWKASLGEEHISLNPKQLPEIIQAIEMQNS